MPGVPFRGTPPPGRYDRRITALETWELSQTGPNRHAGRPVLIPRCTPDPLPSATPPPNPKTAGHMSTTGPVGSGQRPAAPTLLLLTATLKRSFSNHIGNYIQHGVIIAHRHKYRGDAVPQTRTAHATSAPGRWLCEPGAAKAPTEDHPKGITSRADPRNSSLCLSGPMPMTPTVIWAADPIRSWAKYAEQRQRIPPDRSSLRAHNHLPPLHPPRTPTRTTGNPNHPPERKTPTRRRP